MIPFSVLDLCPIREGGDAAESFRHSLDLARHAERLGYRRFWLAEHHSLPGVACAATSVLIAHIGGGTKTIRIGSGGIMLPNHPPLVIAEQFGTLESLFPGRIDLGLGRAPGSDQATSQALRRDPMAGEDFPKEVGELLYWFSPERPGQRVTAVPGAGLSIPIWILGSSTWGAQFAAVNGFPYAFASHFAPQMMMEALHLYRTMFKPSPWLDKPYAMLGVNVIGAETDAEAELLFTSRQQSTIANRTGRRNVLPPPDPDFAKKLGPMERSIIDELAPGSILGAPATLKAGLQDFIKRTQADELIITAAIYDHARRLRSYEIAAQVRDELAREGWSAAA